jgi:hypothetical protein
METGVGVSPMGLGTVRERQDWTQPLWTPVVLVRQLASVNGQESIQRSTHVLAPRTETPIAYHPYLIKVSDTFVT